MANSRDEQLRNSRRLARQLIGAAALVLIVAASALAVRVLLIPIVFLPGAAAWAFTKVLEPVFRRYQPPEPEDPPEEE